MKYNMSRIMKRAWAIKAEDARYIFSMCLRMAWAEVRNGENKEMTKEEKIKVLEAKGFKRWTKGNMDRMYANPAVLGVRFAYYTTGSIKECWLHDDKLSNCEGGRIKASKNYIDLADFTAHSNHKYMQEELERVLAEIA